MSVVVCQPQQEDNGHAVSTIEPPGTALLIAVPEELEAVEDHHSQATLLSAGMVRAGQALEVAARIYADMRSFLEGSTPATRRCQH